MEKPRNNLLDLLSGIIIPIAPEGRLFIFIFAIITIILMMFSLILGFIGLVLTVWCASFFRDPKRVTPQGDNLVISPADGVVQKIDYATPPAELNMESKEMLRICIFMNVFNVHVNRIPSNGVIKEIKYNKGKFLNASVDKASTENERCSYLMKTKNNKDIAFVQIAGLVARRIITFADRSTNSMEVMAGQRFGLIRFGSRVDVYLPKEIKPLVIAGQKAVAGETIIANLENTTISYDGVVLENRIGR